MTDTGKVDELSKFRALGNRVLIRPDASPEKTRLGILLPHGSRGDQGKTEWATVLSVGEKCTQLQVNDRVLVVFYQGEKIKLEKADGTREEFVSILENECLLYKREE